MFVVHLVYVSATMLFLPAEYFTVQLKGCKSVVELSIAAFWGKRLKKE